MLGVLGFVSWRGLDGRAIERGPAGLAITGRQAARWLASCWLASCWLAPWLAGPLLAGLLLAGPGPARNGRRLARPWPAARMAAAVCPAARLSPHQAAFLLVPAVWAIADQIGGGRRGRRLGRGAPGLGRLGPVVGEEVPPGPVDGAWIGLVALIKLVHQQLVRPEIGA